MKIYFFFAEMRLFKEEFVKALQNSQSKTEATKNGAVTVFAANEPISKEAIAHKPPELSYLQNAMEEEEQSGTDETWTQRDQRLLEIALQQFPKGTADR